MPALDLTLRLDMEPRNANVAHALVRFPPTLRLMIFCRSISSSLIETDFMVNKNISSLLIVPSRQFAKIAVEQRDHFVDGGANGFIDSVRLIGCHDRV
jgi:hypothetical protein